MLHDYHSRPFAHNRRRSWPRILGWIVAVTPFILLVLLWLGCGDAEISRWK